jgi:hypothetical protein
MVKKIEALIFAYFSNPKRTRVSEKTLINIKNHE